MRFADKIWNNIMLLRKKVLVGRNLRVNGRLFIHGDKGGVTFGDNCMVNSSESINPTSGINHSHLVVGHGAKLIIGNHVGMSHVNITAYVGITIDDNVMLGSGVKIWDNDFHSINYKDRINGFHNVNGAPVHICEGAFVGACSIILKGVTVGKHSVIGAGSVVTKNIPDGEVWAGNPAKFLKRVASE